MTNGNNEEELESSAAEGLFIPFPCIKINCFMIYGRQYFLRHIFMIPLLYAMFYETLLSDSVYNVLWDIYLAGMFITNLWDDYYVIWYTVYCEILLTVILLSLSDQQQGGNYQQNQSSWSKFFISLFLCRPHLLGDI